MADTSSGGASLKPPVIVLHEQHYLVRKCICLNDGVAGLHVLHHNLG
jgi:hypothetical protein